MGLQTLKDIREVIGQKGQWTDATYNTVIRNGINWAYKVILDKSDWADLYAVQDVSVADGDQEIGLPQDIDQILGIVDTGSSITMTEMNLQEMFDRFHEDLGAGPPSHFARMGTLSVKVQPTAAYNILLASAEGDAGQSCRVIGSLGGVLQENTVVLIANASASTSATYDEVVRVTKDGQTDGAVSISANSVTLGSIAPTESTSDYPWIRFERPAEGARTIRVFYRRHAPDLVADYDAPLLSGIGHLLVAGGFVEMLEAQRQFEKAAVKRAEFMFLLDEYVFMRAGEACGDRFQPDQAWLAQRR